MSQLSKVLVFGATGEVGSAAALEAHARGAHVTLAMRDVTKPNEWITAEQERAAGLARIAADLTRPADVTRAVRESGAQAVFIYAVRSDDLMRGALAALRDAGGVQHVVFLSTSQIAGRADADLRAVPRDYFIPWQHAQVELGLRELGLPHTALRPGFFASNPLRLYLDRAPGPKQVHLLAPEVPHDPIDPSDIGRTAGALLVEPADPARDVVFLGGPELLSQARQWEIINRELAAAEKPPVTVNTITPEEYISMMDARHVPAVISKSLAKSMVEAKALHENGDYEDYKDNVERLTGRKSTTFQDFVRREIPRYFK